MRTEDKTTGASCAQCGDKSPTEGFTTKDVIHQKWDQSRGKKYVGKTRFTVCAGKPCGSHIQMAYEG